MQKNGRTFTYYTFFRNKQQAKNWANWKRRQGFLVRIVKGKTTKGVIYRIWAA